MTRNNIRFSVHNTEYGEYSEDEQEDESLFMVNMVNLLAPFFSVINTTQIDPIQIDDRQNVESNKQKITEVHPKHSLLYVDVNDKKYESCIICTEEFKNTDVVSVLNCDHIYHPKCIKEWCNRNASCPLCKAEISVSRSKLCESRSRRISHVYIGR